MAIDASLLQLNPGAFQTSYYAEQAAQTAYLQSKQRNESEQIAINRAQEAFDEVYKTATLTGTINGQDTLQKIAQQAALTGMYNGQPTETARQFNVTESGMLNNAPTVSEQQVQNTATNQYLTLLASLKGPQNAFQYAKVLNGTPNGLTDIVKAASGRLNMPNAGGGSASNSGGMSVGANGQLTAASPQGLISDVNNPGQAQPPATSALPNPGQIDPLAWQRFDPTQKSLLTADYQNQGWDPNDVNAMRQASMPGFRNATRGGVVGLFGG